MGSEWLEIISRDVSISSAYRTKYRIICLIELFNVHGITPIKQSDTIIWMIALVSKQNVLQYQHSDGGYEEKLVIRI